MYRLSSEASLCRVCYKQGLPRPVFINQWDHSTMVCQLQIILFSDWPTFQELSMRPYKIHCTFYCHRIVKISLLLRLQARTLRYAAPPIGKFQPFSKFLSYCILWEEEKKREKKNDTWHWTPHTWQVTHDMWHVTPDMWHLVGGELSLEISAPYSYNLGYTVFWRYFSQRISRSHNEWNIKMFVEQPQLYRVC